MSTLPPYKSPTLLFNGHLQTIYSSLCRRLKVPDYHRERISTPDDDFLDLDWLARGNNRLAIISHGLEGDSRRTYVVGMVHALMTESWDALAWNFRGCGGEINRRPRFTHNGATDDLHSVVKHAVATSRYERIVLVGFSMGGNLTLVYLGRDPEKVPSLVSSAVLLSVPCDLASAADRLAHFENRIYMQRFLRLMGRKVRAQAERYPDKFNLDGYEKMSTFRDFDDRYTAPLHGFRNAAHYWQECSGRNYIERIRVPTTIINAQNDSFLTPECFPYRLVDANPAVKLIVTASGGHCGFPRFHSHTCYWSEEVTTLLLRQSIVR